MGCLACSPGTGSCATYSPGEPCASGFDCASNLCLGGCCCSASALQTLGCGSCNCLAGLNGSASLQLAGACASPAPAASNASLANLACNASTSLNATVPLSRVIAFPASANVTEPAPLILLPAASPLNTYGVDIVVSTASACAAFAANAAATQCSAFSYALASGTYYYLGTAAALGMAATPGCAA